MAEKAGLRPPQQPNDYAVGIKEVIELSPQQIEERFNLTGREGAAHSFVGAVTAGLFGGGFLYTNYDNVSLGLVIRISDLMEREPGVEAPELFENFKKRPEIQAVIRGGASVEYSAHVIPEAGIGGVPRLFADGMLVAGDAAGFTLNTGLTVRGMEFALASGALAAKAIITAREKKDYSGRSLSVYQDLLKESFVLKDLATFKDAPGFLDNPRLFTLYPQLACDIFEKMMFIGDGPKKKLSSTAMDEIRRRVPFSAAGDFFKAFRI
jgi:electron transfer flavoprotein-quinone oxidoreductase